jgi:hypothetical protein
LWKMSSYNRSMVAYSMFATLMTDCNLSSGRWSSTVKLCHDLNPSNLEKEEPHFFGSYS